MRMDGKNYDMHESGDIDYIIACCLPELVSYHCYIMQTWISYPYSLHCSSLLLLMSWQLGIVIVIVIAYMTWRDVTPHRYQFYGRQAKWKSRRVANHNDIASIQVTLCACAVWHSRFHVLWKTCTKILKIEKTAQCNHSCWWFIALHCTASHSSETIANHKNICYKS